MAKDRAVETAEKKVKAIMRSELSKLPQVAEVLSYFLHYAGGPSELARLLWEEFKSAKPGSSIKQRTLDMIVKMLTFVNATEGTKRDTEHMEDDEIEREMLEIVRSVPEAVLDSDAEGGDAEEEEDSGDHS